MSDNYDKILKEAFYVANEAVRNFNEKAIKEKKNLSKEERIAHARNVFSIIYTKYAADNNVPRYIILDKLSQMNR